MAIAAENTANVRRWLADQLWKACTREWRGWALWAVFAIVVAATQFPVLPFAGNVFRVYRDAGCHWREGQPLYDGTGTGFLYLPQCAMLCVPLAFLSFQWGGVLWRIVNIAIFASGVWRFVRLAGRSESPTMFPLVSLIVILLSWSAARHGQMTLAMGGLMLHAVVDLVDKQWWRAVLWMTLGVALKPLMIVLMLLAAILYPRTSWRMLLSVVALVALPLAAQRPDYVLEQYRQCLQMFNDATALGPSPQFPHLFWLLKTVGVDIPARGQTALRLLAAALTLAICWVARKRCNGAQAGVLLYTLAVVYLMLFNPRTEHNSYCLLTPPLAIYATQAIAARRWLIATTLIGMAAAMLASYPLGELMSTVWLKPLLCILFLAIVLWRFWKRLA